MTEDKKINNVLDEEYLTFIQKLVDKEKEFRTRLKNKIELLKYKKRGAFFNFFFPGYNKVIDEMILISHSFITDSETRFAKIEKTLKENQDYFLKQK